LVGIEFLFVLRLFSFESKISFTVLTKLCMLKCRHLRVRVKAPKVAGMEERGASTAPSATTSNGPSSFASRNVGFAGGKDREEEEEEGQGDDEEREEDE
jgi:hypothetical protein